MPKNLTDSIVRTLRPAKGQKGWIDHADGACRGLRLRLSSTGEKAWGVQVKVGEARKRHHLGFYPAVTLAEAREKARHYQALARQGIAPAQADAAEKAKGLTVGELYEKYLQEGHKHSQKAPEGFRPSTMAGKKTLYGKYIGPSLGTVPVRALDKARLAAVVAAVRTKGYEVQANRVIAELSAFLTWALKVDLLDEMPRLPEKSKEASRKRHLSRRELSVAYITAETMSERARDLVQLIILLGQRRAEIQNMQWSEIDWDLRIWVIPAGRYKTKAPHVVPLPQAVLKILKRRRTGAEGPFVLPGDDPAKAYNGVSRALKTLQERCGLPLFTLHDLRRTLRTELLRLKVSDDVARSVVGHRKRGMDGVYNMYEYLDERREALELWASDVLEAVHVERTRRAELP